MSGKKSKTEQKVEASEEKKILKKGASPKLDEPSVVDETPEVDKKKSPEVDKKTKKEAKVEDQEDQEDQEEDQDQDAEEDQNASDSEAEEAEDSKVKKSTKKSTKSSTKEASDEEEDASDEESKPKKKASKLDKPSKKGKVEAKESKKGKGKGKSTEKTNEAIQLEAALELASQQLVLIHEKFATRNSHGNISKVVGMYVLSAIDDIQCKEVVVDDPYTYNPFPSGKFVLLADKMNEDDGSKASKVKKDGTVVKATTKSKLPQKRGAKATETKEEEKPEPKSKKVAVVSEEDTTTKVKPKNIVTFNVSGKNYLAFIVLRFIDDLYSFADIPNPKKITSEEAFTNLVMSSISADESSHLSKYIVTTVNRYENCVSFMQEHKYDTYIGKYIMALFPEAENVAKWINHYLMRYLQLIGYTIAQHLWVSKSNVTFQMMDRAVRSLNIGNKEYMLQNNQLKENDSDFELYRGFYSGCRRFDALLNPPPTEEEKQKRSAKLKAGKEKKAEAGTEKSAKKDEKKTTKKAEAEKKTAKKPAKKPAKKEEEDEEPSEEEEEEASEEEPSDEEGSPSKD